MKVFSAAILKCRRRRYPSLRKPGSTLKAAMSHSTTLYGEQKRRPRRQICPMPAPAVRFCSIKHSIRSRHALKFCQVVVFPRAKPPVEANLDRVKVLTVGGQAERYRCRSKSLDGSNQGHVSCGVPYSCVFVGCHLRRKIFEFAVSHDPHKRWISGQTLPIYRPDSA